MVRELDEIEQMIDEGLHYLSEQDSVIARLIEHHGPPALPSGRGPFESLVRSILSQQISGGAARTIIGRVEELAGGLKEPDMLSGVREEDLASCGVSGQKRRYLASLLEHIEDGSLNLKELSRFEDDEVVERLTAVTGIGTWTAKMFLMFTLGRLDVLPFEDLGVRNGLRIAYELKTQPKEKDVREISHERGWSPYRSLASWYLWRATESMP